MKQKISKTMIYPYLVCAIAGLFFFYKYLLQVSPSVMVGDLMRDFSISGAGLGNLAACFFYAYLVMQIPAGILLDRFNPRWVAIIALFLCAISALTFAFAHSLGVAGLARAMMGLTASFSGIVYLKMVSLWLPPKRFALMAGLMMTIAMMGAMGGQAPISALVSHFGWRTAQIYIGLFGFFLLMLFWLGVRNKGVGERMIEPTSWKGFCHDLKIIVKSKVNWTLSLYASFAFAPFSAFAGLWGVSFLEQAYHLSRTFAATAISAVFIGVAMGCPLLGWISDLLGHRLRVMFVSTFLCLMSICCILYLPIHSIPLLFFLLFCFGFWMSSFMLSYAMARESQSALLVASIMGFMNTIPSIFEALTEPLIGKILDLGWDHTIVGGARVFSAHNYRVGLSLLPIYLTVALMLLMWVARLQKKI